MIALGLGTGLADLPDPFGAVGHAGLAIVLHPATTPLARLRAQSVAARAAEAFLPFSPREEIGADAAMAWLDGRTDGVRAALEAVRGCREYRIAVPVDAAQRTGGARLRAMRDATAAAHRIADRVFTGAAAPRATRLLRRAGNSMILACLLPAPPPLQAVRPHEPGCDAASAGPHAWVTGPWPVFSFVKESCDA